jgi:hypothetical protein
MYSIREFVRRITAEHLARSCGPECRRMRIFSQLSRHFPKALARQARHSDLRWVSRITKRSNKCVERQDIAVGTVHFGGRGSKVVYFILISSVTIRLLYDRI